LPPRDESARRPGRARLTDSPWFWLLVFANAAIMGVAIIGPKYNQRQVAVERRYEARREIARRAAAEASGISETDAASPPAAAENDPAVEHGPAGDSAHIVPLAPLALVLVAVNLLAIVLFFAHQVRLMRLEAENSEPRGP